MSSRWGTLAADNATIMAVFDVEGPAPPGTVALPDNAEVGWARNQDGSCSPSAFANLKPYFHSRLIGAIQSIPAAIANTTAQTAFTSTIDLAAGTLAAPALIDARILGVFSSGLVAPTLRLRLKFDNAIILDSGAIQTPVSATDRAWAMGASFLIMPGEVDVQGFAKLWTGVTGVTEALLANTITQAPNFGNVHTISLSAQWSIASANNSVQLRQMALFRQG